MQDELLWGAAWLYKATKIPQYWDYVKNNIQFLGPTVVRNINGILVASLTGDVTEFGWDSKHAGINILVSQVSFQE